ncbi:MAG: AI-2E family transporter [Ktedonobacteraceae bacterium]|nr:AI-2E family transporter [Ktedonobacteraceae bacterium]
MERIDWQRTRDILISIICIGIILWAVGNILGQFVETIIILLLSMAVAFLMTPLANLLERVGLPRVLATLVSYVFVLGLIGGFGYSLIFSLVQQAITFSAAITSIAASLPDNLRSLILFLEKQGGIPAENIQAVINQIQGQATDFAKTLASNAVNFVFILTNAFLDILLVIVLSFYLTLDGKRIRESLISLVPHRSLSNALLFEEALNRVVGNYIRGQLILAVIIGIATGIVCMITGLGDYALICGLLAFLFETIPMVGPGLASITPILLSLLLPGPVFARTTEVVIAFVIIQVIESNILGPRIVGHAVGLHPVAAILTLLVGARLFGVFGALLATPIVAAIWVVIASVYRSARGETADQILAKKRAPWQIRRPFIQAAQEKKPPASGPGLDSGSGPEQDHVRSRQRQKEN